MNASEFTEPFELERWIAGELATDASSKVVTFKSSRDNYYFYVNESDNQYAPYSSLAYMKEKWRMKPKASDDGWIPVVVGKCPIDQTDHRKYEARLMDGTIGPIEYIDIHDTNLWETIWGKESIAAVRLIKPAEKKDAHSISVQESIELQDWLLQKKKESPKQRYTSENYAFKNPSDAYLRFRQSPRGKDALAKIGKGDAPSYRALGDSGIEAIAAAALVEHDRVWPVKRA